MRVVIHDLEQGRAALAAASGRPVELVSPPGAALFHGVGWWKALAAILRAEFPDASFTARLDCGPAPGLALAALRVGVTHVAVDAPPDVLARLRAMGLDTP